MAAGAGKKMGGGVPALGWWLMVVGAVRLAVTWSGFFDAAALGSATYAHAQVILGLAPDASKLRFTHAVTGVHGRTFGVWTLLSSTLCFLCAFNLDSRPIYAATFMSFVYGYGHFILEYLVYRTFTAANLGTFALVAVTSMVWMLLQWNSHGHGPRVAAKQS
ncbi:ergosterol biosynthetic protein 28-like isoform X1 [Panicum hallii]|uniref:ergosterol biosynthetic protein 28-like isoform X1 n=1 Tax=Panicum hallii TaxID=206008 RepID=UPI000DF4DA31|nr:ergosterol biosynthetic protein 28-like isoform X1 [Panicum hallii]